MYNLQIQQYQLKDKLRWEQNSDCRWNLNNEIQRVRRLMESTLARHTNRSAEDIRTDIERDKILTAQGAVDYGLIDSILESRKAAALV